MTKGQDYYRQNILDDAWVRVFSSTNTAMFTYPYLLGSPKAASPTLSSMCETYIMDSAIGDEDIGNERVLQKAMELGADVLTPADVLHNPDETTERTRDMFVRLADVDYDPTVLVPLHPCPDDGRLHIDHYYKMRTMCEDQGIDLTDHWLSIGGVKDMSPPTQLESIITVRELADEGQHLHGLGFGATSDWIAVFRQHQHLLDSLDMSSIIKDIIKARRLFRPRGDRVDYRLPRGTNSTVVSVMLREFVLYLLNYLLGPHPRESDVPTEIESEAMRDVLQSYGLTDNESVETPATAD